MYLLLMKHYSERWVRVKHEVEVVFSNKADD